MSAIAPPFLSQFDPLEVGEGSIDPLGLAAAYEQLADNVLPGITVRMGKPRFLTLIAVGAHVCRDIDLDAVANDQVSPPYLVFEWWLLEAFHRGRELLAEVSGIPGLRKVSGTVRAGRRVGSAGYLKVPSVFGFTGVFRRLAVRARILTQSGMLDDEGHRLVELWAHEQGLEGFTQGSGGSGAELRSDLLKAIREGLANGTTGERSSAFWGRLVQHLDPSKPGPRERELLAELIESYAGDAEEVRCLNRALCERSETLDPLGEPELLRRVALDAPPRLCAALEAIDAYESFCQPLTQAFSWIRYLASAAPSDGVNTQQYAKSAPAESLVQAMQRGISRVSGNQVIEEKWKTRADTLQLLREGIVQKGLFETVLEQHQEAQRRKPPQPKRMWLEPKSSGQWLIRAAYRLAEPPSDVDAYVHEYRLPTLSRFLAQLGKLR